MEKQQLLNFLKNGVQYEEFKPFIVEYCISKGKEPDLTDAFVEMLPFNPILLNQVVNQILEEESIEHNIVKLFNKNNQLIQILTYE